MDDVFLAWASEQEMNKVISGEIPYDISPWNLSSRYHHEDRIGVVLNIPHGETELARPIALVLGKENERRTFARFATLREDYAPLSAWTHIIPRSLFEKLDDVDVKPSLNGFETGWIGLIVAEALLLSNRPINSLRLPACFSTLSYALGRAQAIWPRVNYEEVTQRYVTAVGLVRSAGFHAELAKQLEPVWFALINARDALPVRGNPVSSALIAAQSYRGDDPRAVAEAIKYAMIDWPDVQILDEFTSLHPEARLQMFDHVIDELRIAKSKERRDVLSFLAGYMASSAAGGSPSLKLAEDISSKYPAVLAWAYVLIGIGLKNSWSSAFAGLGRHIWRELARPFHLAEPPTCDFALDEAVSVYDKQLSDPLVHLKIKQRNFSIGLLPGVNISLNSVEAPAAGTTSSHTTRSDNRRDLSQLADDLWPFLVSRLRTETGQQTAVGKTNNVKRRNSNQSKFKLD